MQKKNSPRATCIFLFYARYRSYRRTHARRSMCTYRMTMRIKSNFLARRAPLVFSLALKNPPHASAIGRLRTCESKLPRWLSIKLMRLSSGGQDTAKLRNEQGNKSCFAAKTLVKMQKQKKISGRRHGKNSKKTFYLQQRASYFSHHVVRDLFHVAPRSTI